MNLIMCIELIVYMNLKLHCIYLLNMCHMYLCFTHMMMDHASSITWNQVAWVVCINILMYIYIFICTYINILYIYVYIRHAVDHIYICTDILDMLLIRYSHEMIDDGSVVETTWVYIWIVLMGQTLDTTMIANQA